ncbi:hypothetical protein [Streptomyces sp. NPDC127112]|uniref:hypothetical protein n=1 Tax=Streptomyces sp. NPDC127112 TaxID=3345364 RepID=UPI00362C6798
MNQSFDVTGDLDGGPEGNQFGDNSRQPLPRLRDIGEQLERVGLCGMQGQPGFPVPGVEVEELAPDTLPYLDDLVTRVMSVTHRPMSLPCGLVGPFSRVA